MLSRIADVLDQCASKFGSVGPAIRIRSARPAMTVIGLFRSCETVLTKSFFICSRFFSKVMSRSTTASPTGSPKGVTTWTRLACAVRPSGSGSSEMPGSPFTNSSRSGS